MKKPVKTQGGTVQRFSARLEMGGRALGWTVAHVPFSPSNVWREMLRLRVCGEMNGYAFRTSLFPVEGKPGAFYLLVNRTVQAGGKAGLGDVAEFTLEPDLEQREAELPDELAALLEEEQGLRSFYDGMTEYARREIGKWIAGVKGDEARLRRCEQMAERLMLTMEAMQELPPVVQAAFRLRPRARAGWMKLTETQRRNELFAVFYYRTPQSREKRVQGLCDTAEKRVSL